jgi:hypothetical protein
MERVVVSILALAAAPATAISLGIIANNGFGVPPTEIRLNALSSAGYMVIVACLGIHTEAKKVAIGPALTPAEHSASHVTRGGRSTPS